MTEPNPTHNPNKDESFEQRNAYFRVRLDSILNPKVSGDNIDDFAQIALYDLVTLANEVIAAYKNGHSYATDTQENRHLEDAAFSEIGIQDIEEILNTIQDKIEQLQAIDKIISQIDIKDQTIVPPDSKAMPLGDGSSELKEKQLFDRLKLLIYILDNDLDIDIGSLLLTKGTNNPSMMRKESYVSIEVDDLNRVIMVCDEEGNATFVFDADLLKLKGVSIDQLHNMTKNEYIELISQNPGVGERLIYSDNWRDNITKLLLETIGTNNQNSNKITFQQKSEFAKNKIWPSFDQFMNEVRAVYSGEANVRDWYKQERQNHPLWPSQPNQTYKDQGWIGFPELVGKENRLKKEYPSFAEFMNEVRAIYTGEVGISNWYHQQRKIHPLWPAEPNKAYKDQGWIGWPELVGKENRYKEWLSFVEFQADVSRHYKGVAEVQKWYTQEQKIHPLWPSQPNQTYKDQGWIGFPELVGKESPYKEWPSFDVFMNEVRAVYSGQGGVQRWYKQEQKKHPTWPSNPDKKYKDQGWEGYGALVGRE